MRKSTRTDPNDSESLISRKSVDTSMQGTSVLSRSPGVKTKRYVQNGERITEKIVYLDHPDTKRKFEELCEKVLVLTLEVITLKQSNTNLKSQLSAQDFGKGGFPNRFENPSSSNSELQAIIKQKERDIADLKKIITSGSGKNISLMMLEEENQFLKQKVKEFDVSFETSHKKFEGRLLEINRSLKRSNDECQYYKDHYFKAKEIIDFSEKKSINPQQIASMSNIDRPFSPMKTIETKSQNRLFNDDNPDSSFQDYSGFDKKNPRNLRSENFQSPLPVETTKIVNDLKSRIERLQEENLSLRKTIQTNGSHSRETFTKNPFSDINQSTEGALQQKLSKALESIKKLENGKIDLEELLEDKMRFITELENVNAMNNERIKFLEDFGREKERTITETFKNEIEYLNKTVDEKSKNINSLKLEISQKVDQFETLKEKLRKQETLLENTSKREANNWAVIIEEKSKTVSELKVSLSEKDKQIELLKSMIQENQTSRNRSLDNEVEHLRQQLKEKTSLAHEVMTTNKKLESQISSRKVSLDRQTDLLKEKETLTKDLFNLKNLLADKTQVIEDLKLQLQMKESVLNDSKDDLANQFEEIVNEKKYLDEQLRSKNKLIDELRKKVQNLEDKHQEKYQQLLRKQASFDNDSYEKQLLTDMIDQKNKNISDLKDEISMKNREIDTLKGKSPQDNHNIIKVLKNEIDALNDEVKEQSKTIDDLKGKIAIKDKHIENLTDNLKILQTEKDPRDLNPIANIYNARPYRAQTEPNFSNQDDSLNNKSPLKNKTYAQPGFQNQSGPTNNNPNNYRDVYGGKNPSINHQSSYDNQNPDNNYQDDFTKRNDPNPYDRNTQSYNGKPIQGNKNINDPYNQIDENSDNNDTRPYGKSPNGSRNNNPYNQNDDPDYGLIPSDRKNISHLKNPNNPSSNNLPAQDYDKYGNPLRNQSNFSAQKGNPYDDLDHVKNSQPDPVIRLNPKYSYNNQSLNPQNEGDQPSQYDRFPSTRGNNQSSSNNPYPLYNNDSDDIPRGNRSRPTDSGQYNNDNNPTNRQSLNSNREQSRYDKPYPTANHDLADPRNNSQSKRGLSNAINDDYYNGGNNKNISPHNINSNTGYNQPDAERNSNRNPAYSSPNYPSPLKSNQPDQLQNRQPAYSTPNHPPGNYTNANKAPFRNNSEVSPNFIDDPNNGNRNSVRNPTQSNYDNGPYPHNRSGAYSTPNYIQVPYENMGEPSNRQVAFSTPHDDFGSHAFDRNNSNYLNEPFDAMNKKKVNSSGNGNHNNLNDPYDIYNSKQNPNENGYPLTNRIPSQSSPQNKYPLNDTYDHNSIRNPAYSSPSNPQDHSSKDNRNPFYPNDPYANPNNSSARISHNNPNGPYNPNNQPNNSNNPKKDTSLNQQQPLNQDNTKGNLPSNRNVAQSLPYNNHKYMPNNQAPDSLSPNNPHYDYLRNSNRNFTNDQNNTHLSANDNLRNSNRHVAFSTPDNIQRMPVNSNLASNRPNILDPANNLYKQKNANPFETSAENSRQPDGTRSTGNIRANSTDIKTPVVKIYSERQPSTPVHPHEVNTERKSNGNSGNVPLKNEDLARMKRTSNLSVRSDSPSIYPDKVVRYVKYDPTTDTHKELLYVDNQLINDPQALSHLQANNVINKNTDSRPSFIQNSRAFDAETPKTDNVSNPLNKNRQPNVRDAPDHQALNPSQIAADRRLLSTYQPNSSNYPLKQSNANFHQGSTDQYQVLQDSNYLKSANLTLEARSKEQSYRFKTTNEVYTQRSGSHQETHEYLLDNVSYKSSMDAVGRIERIERIMVQRPFDINKLEDVPQRVLDLYNEIEGYKYDLHVKSKKLEQLFEKYSLAEQEATYFRKQLDMEEEANGNMENFFAELKSLKDHLLVLENRIELLYDENKDLNDQNNILRGDLLMLREKTSAALRMKNFDIDSLMAENNGLTEKVRQLSLELARLKDKLKVVEDQNERHRVDLLQLDSVDDLKDKIRKLQREKDDLAKQLENCKSNSSDSSKEVGKLKADLQDQRSESEKLLRALKLKDREMAELNENMKKLKDNGNKLEKEVLKLQNELKKVREDLEDNLQATIKEKDELLDKHQGLKAQQGQNLENIQKANQGLNDRVADLIKVVAARDQMLNSKESKIKDLTNELRALLQQREADFAVTKKVFTDLKADYPEFYDNIISGSADPTTKIYNAATVGDDIRTFTEYYRTIIYSLIERCLDQDNLIYKKDIENKMLTQKLKEAKLKASTMGEQATLIPQLKTENANLQNQLTDAEDKIGQLQKEIDEYQLLEDNFNKLKDIAQQLQDELEAQREKYYETKLQNDSYKKQRDAAISELDKMKERCIDLDKQLDNRIKLISQLIIKLFIMTTEVERLNGI